ncbi:uncharacterized protein LOC123302444 [Chrysoperla carnea]|uniref:uncharacterized protein LOC123302444 n=1 Tax=Chrysoperla carnea TaxID=189513 RepID=UPI001D098DE8|nr:uncharacterized protein LOC123302444 [Chrysoperla carnea]
MKVFNFILILASFISLSMGKPCLDLFSDMLSTNPLEHVSGLSPPLQTNPFLSMASKLPFSSSALAQSFLPPHHLGTQPSSLLPNPNSSLQAALLSSPYSQLLSSTLPNSSSALALN